MSLQQRPWAVPVGSIVLAAVLATAAPGLFRKGDAQAEPAPAPQAKAEAPAQADPALERAREQIKMLDDLYKNAVVSITSRYVEAGDKQPAIMVAQDVFGAMRKQGWHSAKLVDATGEPMDDANAPQTDFEKDAARAINAGAPYFDRVVGAGADRRLLAATVVPVFMQKCAECHTHKKLGEVLGFIRYDIPVK